MKSGQYSAADLVIDFDTGIVTKQGQPIALPDLTWRTLCCLLTRPGAIVSVDEVIEGVWGDVSVSNETVTQRIKLLRRALGDDSQKPLYIETVRGRGFRFIAVPESPKPLVRNPRLFAVAAAFVLLVMLGLWGMPEKEIASPTDDVVVRMVERAKEYLSRVKLEDNQLAIGLYEEALRRDPNNLDAMVGLSFASSHNASKFNMSIDWAQRAATLARRSIDLGGGAQAYHALGFALDAQGQIDAATVEYEKAIALGPENAAVISSAAYLYQVRGELAKALSYGLRAYALDPNVAFAEVQIAATLYLLGRDSEAEEWMRRGIMLKPDNVFIYSTKTSYLMSRGQFGAAQDTIREAIERGIHRPELLVYGGLIAANTGNMREAQVLFEQATALEPGRAVGDAFLIWLRLIQGEQDAKSLATGWIEEKAVGTTFPASLIVGAGLATGVGDVETALVLLKQAVDYGCLDWRWLSNHPMFANHPMFESIKDSEAFAVLITRVQNLVAAENAKVDASR